MSNHKVIATIDVSRPAGRKIVKELQNKRVVKLKYPLPEETSGEWHDWEEVYEKGVDKLSELYDTDLRELAAKHNIKLTTTVFVEENVKVIIWKEKKDVKGMADTSMGKLPIKFTRKQESKQ